MNNQIPTNLTRRSIHFIYVKWASKRLKSSATRLLALRLVQAKKQNTPKLRIVDDLWRESTGGWLVALTKGQWCRTHYRFMTSTCDNSYVDLFRTLYQDCVCKWFSDCLLSSAKSSEDSILTFSKNIMITDFLFISLLQNLLSKSARYHPIITSHVHTTPSLIG